MTIQSKIKRKRPLLIDTDAGTDDAVALCMLMASDEFDIVGVTTVGGNVAIDHVIQNVLYLVENYERKIPVYRGAAVPLCRPVQSADFIHGKDGLGDLGIDNRGRVPAKGWAAEEILRLSHEYAGELEILTLGPLTNLAVALSMDPSLPLRVKTCHIMGGLYDLPGNITPLAEYNLWADPEATRAVLQPDWQMTLTGWDVTLSGGYLTPEELNQLKDQPHPLSKHIANMQRIAVEWEKKHNGRDHCYLADAAAAAALIAPEIITESISLGASVNCAADGDPARGQLVFDHSSSVRSRINICRGIDRAQFVNLIMQSFDHE